MKFLPLHPERKLLTGCRHVEVVPVYRASAPPYMPLYVVGYPNVHQVKHMGQPAAYMCAICDEWVRAERYAWAFGRTWLLTGWSLMNPGA